MRDFDRAWQVARYIDGWLADVEAELLWDAAQQTPFDGTIVEVGAYRGRSTCLLAQTGRRIITIDPLTPGFGDGNSMEVTEADAIELEKLVSQYPNVTWLRQRSACVAIARIHLLYIDGDHTGTAPLDDFRHFAPTLVAGGFAAFHDFGMFPAVTAAVERLIFNGDLVPADRASSMWLGKKAA
jgi:hypothetical protein